MQIKKEFGQRFWASALERWQTESGGKLTETFVAKKIGVSQGVVNNYKNGEKMPSLAKACQMAILMDVCVEWLLTGRGPKRPAGNANTENISDEQKKALRSLIDTVCGNDA